MGKRKTKKYGWRLREKKRGKKEGKRVKKRNKGKKGEKRIGRHLANSCEKSSIFLEFT